MRIAFSLRWISRTEDSRLTRLTPDPNLLIPDGSWLVGYLRVNGKMIVITLCKNPEPGFQSGPGDSLDAD